MITFIIVLEQVSKTAQSAVSSLSATNRLTNSARDGDFELWLGDGSSGHDAWLTGLTSAVLECFERRSPYREALEKACSLEVSLCARVLPLLLHQLLFSCERVSDLHAAVSSGVAAFFAAHYRAKGYGDGDGQMSRPTTPSTTGGGII